MTERFLRGTAILWVAWVSCSPPPETGGTSSPGGTDAVRPVAVIHDIGDIMFGEPLGVAIDFGGNPYVADGSPGRVVHVDLDSDEALEFQQPARNAGFYPTGVVSYGFFVYAVDGPGRAILRFDKHGAYRDVLLDFDELLEGRRVSPYGIATDGSGRLAVTDVENHQVLLFDSFLSLEVAFGNYGSFAGMFDTPQGVSFAPDGEVVVADTGNRRVQFFGEGGEVRRSVPPSGQPNALRRPRRAVCDEAGGLYVADPVAGRVFVFDRQGNSTDALVPLGVRRFEPTDVALSPNGTLFVTDVATRALYLFKVKH